MLFILTANEHILTEFWLQIVEVAITSVGMSVQWLTYWLCSLFYHLVMNVSLFNTRAFTVESAYIIVNKSFCCVVGFDIIQAYHPRLIHRPGGSQQWKILPSPNSKRAPNFSAQILDRRGNFKGAEILEAQKFYKAEISTSAIVLCLYVRLNFPQQFSAAIFRSKFPQQFSAWIFRLNFGHPPQFSWEAEISCICYILSGC